MLSLHRRRTTFAGIGLRLVLLIWYLVARGVSDTGCTTSAFSACTQRTC